MAYSRPRRLLTSLALVLFISLLAGCSAGGLTPPELPTPTPVEPRQEQPAPALIETPAPPTEAAPTATMPAEPSPTPPPPEPAPRDSSAIEFNPPRLVQGGVTIVYLNEPATGATLSFGGRQYPMLRDGDRWWAIIGVNAMAQPGLAPVTVAYMPESGGQQTSISASIAIEAREFGVEYIYLDPQTASLLAPEIVLAELALRDGIYAGYTTQRLWSGPFQRPSPGAISAVYGEGRSYNDGPVTDFHKGTDFVGPTGAPVYASAAGRVVFVDSLRVRGDSIVIDHGAGVFTAYHHLSAYEVAEGDVVAAGQLIGAIGDSGLVTGPHLHWEVIVRGVEVDGELWLEGTEIGP